MNGLTEDRRIMNIRRALQLRERDSCVWTRHFGPLGIRRRHIRQLLEIVRFAVGDQLRVEDVTDSRAAFRFVHVMSGYEQSYSRAGELKEKIPKLAPRNRVYSGSWFIEKDDLRFMHQR